jgi:hypothetical protein
MAENQQRVALLKTEDMAQLQNTIQQNFAFANPLVQQRSNNYRNAGLTILANYTDAQLTYWKGALSEAEAQANQTTDPAKSLQIIRDFAANTESMRWDETERAKDPTITPANITVTSCSFLDSLGLQIELQANLVKMDAILTLAATQQKFSGDAYLAQFYSNVSYY